MKLGDGVEQAIHCVGLLSGLDGDSVLSAAALAEFHGVSTSYLLKHLQALSGAGLLETVPGPKGGYRLAKPPAEISLLDIVLAVEGPQPAFRCAEIRQRGPNPLPGRYFTKPCGINAAMLKAERAYRAELAKTSMADILEGLAAEDDGGIAARGCAFLNLNQRAAGRKD
ncbi:Rrf2 family transcriptional regulator [Rhizobium sp. FY34]|uniref:RrF2 family transcriptional regulator n=1 Tax=Rhizobium sp. FY34 TaxID=2562309 RepID=UPI0010C070C6|nr:Rrf2 family transcriptional regulator [Rhizobium sp. FY34]